MLSLRLNLLFCLSAACCLLFTACSAPRLTAPTGYAETAESWEFEQKLISPGGTVIALRKFDNPDEKAGLQYWAAALEIQKTKKDRMELVSREDIRTTAGVPGVLFSFEVGEGSSKISYLIGRRSRRQAGRHHDRPGDDPGDHEVARLTGEFVVAVR